MKEKLLETIVSLTETTDTKSAAEKINDFLQSQKCKLQVGYCYRL